MRADNVKKKIKFEIWSFFDFSLIFESSSIEPYRNVRCSEFTELIFFVSFIIS
jgi:hypothetical protein